ncbi:MAG: hypothetical protein GXN95_02085 [Methanococci archaeon]|nr:hypothetical protein [Methanococci archaeon]
MPNITLSIPEEIYLKMKKHREIKWSEVARKAIIDYLRKIEESYEISSEELLEELGEEFKKDIEETDLEVYEKGYKKMREEEWKRQSMIQTSL